MEQVGLLLLVAGAILATIAELWLIVRGFRVHWAWGVGLILVPPLALVFALCHFRKALAPLALFVLAGLVIATPYGINYYYQNHVDLGPREKTVDGELHLTLTGWDQTDYSVLQARPTVVVLQMANGDVTDATLENLRGMTQLRELDLNDTQVTDRGLELLATLPQLRELRLARAKITDEGFRQHLADKESLVKIDLTGTPVKGKTKRDWKQAKTSREYLD
ncbi:MAG: hypothetical protein K2R98_06395 [Gemmataceae bacterium]|nr:hypothetical protein [Gemmataceae bacterium]